MEFGSEKIDFFLANYQNMDVHSRRDRSNCRWSCGQTSDCRSFWRTYEWMPQLFLSLLPVPSLPPSINLCNAGPFPELKVIALSLSLFPMFDPHRAEASSLIETEGQIDQWADVFTSITESSPIGHPICESFRKVTRNAGNFSHIRRRCCICFFCLLPRNKSCFEEMYKVAESLKLQNIVQKNHACFIVNSC